jgi:DNA mismatch endonuclease, patch repair protein
MKRSSSPLTRSEIMSRVRSGDTEIELVIRRLLWARAIRYRVRPKLFGRPDLSIRRVKLAIFIDGCFWHGCPSHYTSPKSNADFWRKKLRRNMERDKLVRKELHRLGWRVMRIWEHQILASPYSVANRIERRVQNLASMQLALEHGQGSDKLK